MTRAPLPLLAATTLIALMGGCQKRADASLWSLGLNDHHARYSGVGIYSPGTSWSRLVGAAAPTSSSAKPVDDQAIIVTVDGETGEVRACGDLSGHCIGMNPWDKPLPASHLVPVELSPPPKAEAADSVPAAQGAQPAR